MRRLPPIAPRQAPANRLPTAPNCPPTSSLPCVQMDRPTTRSSPDQKYNKRQQTMHALLHDIWYYLGRYVSEWRAVAAVPLLRAKLQELVDSGEEPNHELVANTL